MKKMFRSFNAENIGSIGQRAAKLLAAKFGVHKKKSAALAIPPELCAIAFGPGSIPGKLKTRLNALAHNLAGMAEAADFFLRTPTLAASNFAAL